MIQILHNPRCRKSREGLSVLEESGKEFEVINYLENRISEEQLIEIIGKLEIEPIELVRKNEGIWKSDYKGKELSHVQIINAMVKNPKLIERPIIINKDKAVIGRPAEHIKTII